MKIHNRFDAYLQKQIKQVADNYNLPLSDLIKPIEQMDRVTEFRTALPSRVIEIALEDLEAVEQMPETYKIDMGTWHQSFNGKCEVCFAGSVMVNTFNVSEKLKCLPHHFDDDIQVRFYLINDLRQGVLSTGIFVGKFNATAEQCDAIKEIALEIFDSTSSPLAYSYRFAPDQFKAQMREVSRRLKAIGL